MNTNYSEKLFHEASRYLVGGVNSPVRAFKAVEGLPRFISRAHGSSLWDADNNQYIDYMGSWGPAILGHAHPAILRAIHEAMKNGTSFGAPHAHEISLARMVAEALPSMELVRFVNSGTEAGMSVLRLARGYTGRAKIMKFDGCYHGHADSLLVKAGSGAATLGIPDSSGVPEAIASLTLVARYNDLDGVKEYFRGNQGEIAAVIVEPIVGNMGLILPQPGFLQGLREITRNEGSLLIFDEVMTGFRVAYGGTQGLYGIQPDLTCLGKIIGGGLPVGAYGGRKDIMEMVAPLGPVYQAGTLSGNPLAMAAGIATLNELKKMGVYESLESKGRELATGIQGIARARAIPLCVNRAGSILSFFFSDHPVVNADDARQSKTEFFKKLFPLLLENGIYWPPSPFEAAFISLAHSAEDIQYTLLGFKKSFRQLSNSAGLAGC